VESATGLERRMRVQVPAEKIENEVATRLRDVGRTARIQGFRKGKVPAKIIRQRFGPQVRQEVLQEVLQSSYADAVIQEELRPAGGPQIEPENIAEGEDLTYTAVFEVYPEVELKGVDKIKLEKPVVSIGSDDVDNMIQRLREQRGSFAAVERKSADGDQVTIDFEGRHKGEVFEGGTAEDFPVVLGQGAMLADFEKQLFGVKAGDEKTFKMKFPKDYQAENLAGEKVEFSISVKEVAEPQLPELDAELVKAYGIESGDVDELKADIEKNLNRELDAKLKATVKQRVLDGLLDANKIDVPAVLVSQEAEAMQREMMQRMGVSEPEQAPPLDTFKESAEKRVRLGLLLSAAIQDNGIESDQDKVMAKLDEICEPYDNPEEIRKIYLQNQQLLGQIENVVLEEQVVDWLTAQAKQSEKTMSFSELMELQG
jgi:trigger factor